MAGAIGQMHSATADNGLFVDLLEAFDDHSIHISCKDSFTLKAPHFYQTAGFCHSAFCLFKL
jgi:hypothetical protein